MSLHATWLGRESIERIADVRLRCYGNGPADRKSYLDRTANDRFDDGDVLVLSDDTGDVATATSLSLSVNVRGTALPCQGVAWVGTVRSHRRRKIDGRGLASRVMDAMLYRSRERRQAVSMLAPFRVSFYESFGYGVIERQHTWTIPLSTLPQDETPAAFAEYRDADFDAALANRERQFRQTHGDVATDARGLKHWLTSLNASGFRLVDKQGDTITSQFTLGTEIENGQAVAVVHRPYWDSPAALRRLLVLLGTLRDQYSVARITLPTDVPINWWLRERQVPHRRVDHPAARCQMLTRMQGRVLDVPRFVSALKSTPTTAGVITVDVAGTAYRLEIADSQSTATATSAAADFVVDEPTWAAIAFGDLTPANAAMLGRLEVRRPQALPLLTALVSGGTPYCHEYF
ncbi:MAG TPA: GNAT family N-acetyltransferase [Tepidisphaeraceae bacterium]|jgi:predicted acetyltransferase